MTGSSAVVAIHDRWSLTTRVAVYVSTLVTAIMVVTGTFVYVQVHHAMISQVTSQQQLLVQQLSPVDASQGAGSQSGNQVGSGNESPDMGNPEFWSQLVPPDQGMVYTGGTILSTTADFPKSLKTTDWRPGKVVRRSFRGTPYILSAYSSGKYTFVIASPFRAQSQFLAALVRYLIIAGVLALLLAALTSYFTAKRALSPLKALTSAVESFGENNLDLRVSLQRPHDEIFALGTAFNVMAKRVETSFTRERRFVADASHELRTPVTIIKGYSRMLSQWAKAKPQLLDEGLAAISEATSVMSNLISQLLSLASGESHELQVEPVAIGEIARAGNRALQVLAGKHQVNYDEGKVDPSSLILADPGAAREAILVLVDNAVKYTPDGGTITVSLQQRSGEIGIAIIDNGPGISADDLPHVFDRFYRVDKARDPNAGGHGLGLSIADRLMRGQGGRIEVNSVLDQGSTFTLWWERA